jgi:Zn finger protein HypA/HybF involved in hydrogenase expression
MESYFKPEQYYTDLYDLGTLRECLHYYQSLYKELPKALELPNTENLSEEKRKTDWLKVMNIVVYSIKIQRFKEKRATVDKWMQSDRTKQERFDNAESGEFYCKTCSVLLEETDKHLHDYLNEELKVLFLYKCPKCGKREGYYDNGKAYESKPTLCEKCGSEVDVSLKIDDKKDITTWTYKCTGCDYKKVDVDDHKKWKVEHDLKEKKDKELLEKFRKDFCFTEEEGNHAVQRSENLSDLMKDIKSREEQKKDPVYQKAISLKKLKVVEVNKLLKEAVEKEGFIELQFEKPEMGRFVAVPFVVQDGKPERSDYDSKTTLKKLITGVLEGTNWRLMSEGVDYRVGYLSGKLRCYENERDLVEVLK